VARAQAYFRDAHPDIDPIRNALIKMGRSAECPTRLALRRQISILLEQQLADGHV
jgi:hypothetical protein